jgi:dihydrofolate reductase
LRRVALNMYITLDGFNDFPDYPGSGDPPNNEEGGASEEMWVKNWDSTDTLLFDEETYEQWMDFWPLSKRTEAEHPFYHQMSRFTEKAQKVVFSDTAKDSLWANTRFLSNNISMEVAKLRSEQGKNMAIVAPKLAQKCMTIGLIDDYFFLFFPVILGKGQRLFEGLEKQQTLKLVDEKHYKHGEVFLHYETLRQ